MEVPKIESKKPKIIKEMPPLHKSKYDEKIEIVIDKNAIQSSEIELTENHSNENEKKWNSFLRMNKINQDCTESGFMNLNFSYRQNQSELLVILSHVLQFKIESKRDIIDFNENEIEKIVFLNFLFANSC